VASVLVIEDNPDLAYGLRNNLEIEGHEVTVAGNGPDGLDRASRGDLDLIILDLMLPGLDGFRVLRALRERDRETPVLILTARGEEADKVRGLKLGADDYVTKPFGVLELLARVEAQLRRRWAASGPKGVIRVGDIEVDRRARIVRRSGQPVSLAPKELDLLLALLDSAGAAVSRMTLMNQVWGYQADVLSRTVDSHIAELRRKLEHDPGRPRHLITVRKFGYRLER
jgi:two-component system alkaline phosphatase synthesis response regulator PhoP